MGSKPSTLLVTFPPTHFFLLYLFFCTSWLIGLRNCHIARVSGRRLFFRLCEKSFSPLPGSVPGTPFTWQRVRIRPPYPPPPTNQPFPPPPPPLNVFLFFEFPLVPDFLPVCQSGFFFFRVLPHGSWVPHFAFLRCLRHFFVPFWNLQFRPHASL